MTRRPLPLRLPVRCGLALLVSGAWACAGSAPGARPPGTSRPAGESLAAADGPRGEVRTTPRVPDAAFVPTSDSVGSVMLEVAAASERDVVYDLGSGDGRIVIAAARERGARGVGIEIDPELVERSRESARRAGVAERVRFMQQDLFEAELRPATVVTLYLGTDLNVRLRPRLLAELAPGSRIVSHNFDMGTWEPDSSARVGTHWVLLWIVPADVEGTWRWTTPAGARSREWELSIDQAFQKLRGALTVDGERAHLEDLRLRGDRLSFVAHLPLGGRGEPLRHAGRVGGGAIEGTVGAEMSGQHGQPWRAKRVRAGG